MNEPWKHAKDYMIYDGQIYVDRSGLWGNWEWERSFFWGSEGSRIVVIDLELWSYCSESHFFSFVVLGIKLSDTCCTHACLSAFLKGRIVYVLLIALCILHNGHSFEYSNHHCHFLGLEHDREQQVVQEWVSKCWNSDLKLWVNWMYPVSTIGFKILPDELIINTQTARNVNQSGSSSWSVAE